MNKKLRIIYTAMFIGLLLTEIIIALYVKDSFIRPYGGDVLITILICSFLRIFTPKKVAALPVYVFIFATAVEVGQYFDMVKLLGLEDSAFFSTLLGRSFAFADIVCYAVGCLLFFIIEKAVINVKKT